MTKFLVAALTAAAVAGSAFTAAAAEPVPTQLVAAQSAAAEPFRLDDAQMDAATAGLDSIQLNIAIVIPIQIVTVTNIVTAIGDGATASAINEIIAQQTTRVIQRNNRGK